MSVRLTNEHRRAQILACAEQQAKKLGLYSPLLKIALVARLAGVSKPTVHKHFQSLIILRNAIIAQSYKGDKIVYRMALTCKDPVAKRLQDDTARTYLL